jgi:hypothetical protein
VFDAIDYIAVEASYPSILQTQRLEHLASRARRSIRHDIEARDLEETLVRTGFLVDVVVGKFPDLRVGMEAREHGRWRRGEIGVTREHGRWGFSIALRRASLITPSRKAKKNSRDNSHRTPPFI